MKKNKTSKIFSIMIPIVVNIICILILVLSFIYREIFFDISIVIAIIFFIGFTIFMICYFIKKINNKKKLNFLDNNDVEKVRQYYDKKVFTLLNAKSDEIELYDAFETMWDVCGFFLNMEQSIGYKRNEIITEEDIDKIKKINSRNLNKMYKDTEQMLDIIYSYYDEEGNRKI